MVKVDNYIQIKNLTVSFELEGEYIEVLKNINTTISHGSVTAIAGATGCGKSTLGKAIAGFLDANAHVSGEIFFKGENLLTLDAKQKQAIYGKQLNILFQEPLAALDPLLKIGSHFKEVLGEPKDWKYKAIKWLNKSGINEAEQVLQFYPYQISTGMAQKIVFALLAANPPELLIVDEPTASMDPISQLVVRKLLQQLLSTTNLTMILITHDIDLIELFAKKLIIIANGAIAQELNLNGISDLSTVVTEPSTFNSIRYLYAWRKKQ
jgi:ABC-type glutathione transport system ATPase component